MKSRSSRTPFLALVLAFVAVLGMNLVSAYHNALPHDDDHIELSDGTGHHKQDSKDDHDGVAHQAMHEVVHGIGIPQLPAYETAAVPIGSTWTMGISPVFSGIASPLILRPPQA